MVVLNEKIRIGKKGINYVTTVTDNSMCVFHPIQQENDIGIDGHLELFDEDRKPTGQLVSVQVKTGKSYYNLDKRECLIPVEAHKEYWMRLKVPVLGIVCVMDEKYEEVETAYWIDIKEYLSKEPNTTMIKFGMSKSNEYSKEKFRKYFYQLISGRLPSIDFNESIDLLKGSNEDKCMAIAELQIKHSANIDSWKMLFEMYENRSPYLDLKLFFEALSYAYPHPDHWYSKGFHEFSCESKDYVINRVKKFEKKDIVNLLSTIQNHYFDRGTMGQTVEIIIKHIDYSEEKMLQIVLDSEINGDIRSDAEMILAYHDSKKYLENIEEIKRTESQFTDMILKFIADFGEYDFY